MDDEPHGRDAKVVIDTGLGILAADPDRFAEYERQVRQEYAWVPEPEYKARRSDVLRRLLARPRLFSTPVFQRRYETQARRNIAGSLERLASGG